MQPSRRRRIGAPPYRKRRQVALTLPDCNCSACGAGVPDHYQSFVENLDENGPDLISNLPDCVLSSIIDLLPIRDAVRTSILSSRWRNLWKINPLHLDDCSIKSDLLDSEKTIQAVLHIASVHPGPIHLFRISQFQFPRDQGNVDAVIEDLTRKGIICFDLRFGMQGKLRYRLPLSLLQCQTLCRLYLSDCFFPPSPVVNSCFPNLRELSLEFVFLWDDLLNCILKSCSQLEVLQLINCTGLQHIRINCGKLQELTVHECFTSGYAKQITVEDAPELRSLRFGEKTADDTRISVPHVQKLEVLGFLSMEATLQIGRTFSKPHNRYEMSVNENMKLPNIKKLAIVVGFGNESKCSLLAAVLRCLPSIESLSIKCIKSTGPGPDVGFWEQQIPFDFLEHHLKSVCMINFAGLKAEIDFVKHLIKHGQVLERIVIICEHKITVTWEKTKRRQLRVKHGASKILQVVFLRKSDIDSNSCEWLPLCFLPVPNN